MNFVSDLQDITRRIPIWNMIRVDTFGGASSVAGSAAQLNRIATLRYDRDVLIAGIHFSSSFQGGSVIVAACVGYDQGATVSVAAGTVIGTNLLGGHYYQWSAGAPNTLLAQSTWIDYEWPIMPMVSTNQQLAIYMHLTTADRVRAIASVYTVPVPR